MYHAFRVYLLLFVFTNLYVFLSMAWRGTAVAPVLTHWSCRGLAFDQGCSACMIWCVGACVFYLLCLHAYLFYSRTIAHRANVICCTVPDFK